MTTKRIVTETIKHQARSELASLGQIGPDGSWLEDDDTYYYMLNRKNMRYHCEHERHLLRRNLYSKRELDIFFEQMHMYDKKKPARWCGVALLALGMLALGLAILFFILGWREGWDENIKRNKTTTLRVLLYIAAAIFFLIALGLIVYGILMLVGRKNNKTLRKKKLAPVIMDENSRIAPRGLNWRYNDENLALRTNYWGSGKRGAITGAGKTKTVVEETITSNRSPIKKSTVVENVTKRSGRYKNSRIY